MREQMTEEEYHPFLKAFTMVGPFLQSLANEDITIGIYSTDKPPNGVCRDGSSNRIMKNQVVKRQIPGFPLKSHLT